MGVDDHLFLSDLLEVSLTMDLPNLGELESSETISRRSHLWEEICAASSSRGRGGKESSPWLDERQIFLRHERSRGHALVFPDLESWVADRLREKRGGCSRTPPAWTSGSAATPTSRKAAEAVAAIRRAEAMAAGGPRQRLVMKDRHAAAGCPRPCRRSSGAAAP